MLGKKIKTRSEIQQLVSDFRAKNHEVKIVTSNGCFDIIHAGHVHSLVKAKSFGDLLIVGLNSDESVRKYKSSTKRPIIPQQQRAEMLAALEVVDYVVIFDETDSQALLSVIKPDFHVKSKSGFIARPGFVDCNERGVVESNGGKIVAIDDIPGFSSTTIVKRIKELDD